MESFSYPNGIRDAADTGTNHLFMSESGLHSSSLKTHRRGALEPSWEPVEQLFYDYSTFPKTYANELGLSEIPEIALLYGEPDRDLGWSWLVAEERL